MEEKGFENIFSAWMLFLWAIHIIIFYLIYNYTNIIYFLYFIGLSPLYYGICSFSFMKTGILEL